MHPNYKSTINWRCDGMSTIQSTRLSGGSRYLRIKYSVSNEMSCDSRNPCHASVAESGQILWRTPKKETDGAKLIVKKATSFYCDCNTGKEWWVLFKMSHKSVKFHLEN